MATLFEEVPCRKSSSGFCCSPVLKRVMNTFWLSRHTDEEGRGRLLYRPKAFGKASQCTQWKRLLSTRAKSSRHLSRTWGTLCVKHAQRNLCN